MSAESTPAQTVAATDVAQMLRDGSELAFIDVREHGQYGEAHPLRVVSIPYSILEGRIGAFVPRLATRVVLLDDGDGIATRAAHRLAAMGYSGLMVLEGGMPGWEAAGLEVYKGVNVVCKAFGEVVEHACHTPAIDPSELDAMVKAGEDLVIVDGRTPEEFNRMSIPGGMSVPNAELVYRISDIAPNPETTVVVNCAGRTRSIIGAQTLRNAAIPNRVVALRGGTMAWRLSGFQLDNGKPPASPEVTEGGVAGGQDYASRMREKFSVPVTDPATLASWRADDSRTTYLFDVRSDAEYTAGHLPGAAHAPGGQLVQAADHWCAVWGARIVLVDEGSGIRATTTAHWLRQMDWEVYVLTGHGLADLTETGPLPKRKPSLDGTRVERIEKRELEALMAGGEVTLVDVDDSTDYSKGHLPGAIWSIRPRIAEELQAMALAPTVVIYGEHEMRSSLAAIDLAEAIENRVCVLAGGREQWCEEGGALEASPGMPPDEKRLDYLFFVHDRHAGNDQAARDYLAWEENLPAQLKREGEDRFPLVLD